MAKLTEHDATPFNSKSDPNDLRVTNDAVVFFDRDTFREFVDLMGQERARFWLGEFRDGLANEFAHSSGKVHDLESSRASIHKFCARAGLIGFKALQEACFRFLEDTENESSPDDAYQRIRSEIELAYPEIERLRAELA